MGQSSGPAPQRPLLILDDGHGAVSARGRGLRTYVQGLFEAQGACAALLRWAGLRAPLRLDHAERRERMLDRLADTLEQPLALERFVRLG